ncbi:hypothetical protein ScPMuIL_014694 [Solemya velum]
MSWLTGLTGKAESLLNKLDQSAATALHIEKDEAGNPRPTELSSAGYLNQPAYEHRTPPLSPSQSVPTKLNELKHVANAPSFISTPGKQPMNLKPPVTAAGSTVKKKETSDEALFEFLNSKNPLESNKKKATPVSSAQHSRRSSTSSTSSSRGGKPGEATTGLSSMTSSMIDMTGNDSVSEVDGQADIAAIEDAMIEQSPSPSSHDFGGHLVDSQGRLSSLELENKLLKDEIASLHQEMTSLIQRAKAAQTEMVKAKQRLVEYDEYAASSDQRIRDMQAVEADLTEALASKDSQLAVLRVRLEEADRDIDNRRKELQNHQTEKQRILKDHSDSSGVHSQALDSVKEKLREVEDTLKREQEAHKQAQQDAAERRSRLEEEQKSFAESLAVIERKLAEEKTKSTNLSNQLKLSKSNLDGAKNSLSEYKEKAARILQSKERLIASLREGSGASGETVGVSNLEYDSVKQERDMFKEELQLSKMSVDGMRVEIQDLETQLQQEGDEAQEQIKSLEETSMEEKTRREEAEQDLLKQKKELQYAIEEIHKQKFSFQSRITDREEEIEKLRNQLATKAMSSTTESELESRVRALTESLIQKQTMLEALSTEKNSLGLQLERLDRQYKDVQASALRSASSVVHVHEDDDTVRQRIPGFMREGPTDTEVTKRMKRAANTIDRFSIRLGIFLRRYPIARVFVILYMGLLHMWVMIVLMTYQPEMHGSEYQPHAPEK